MGEKQPFRIHKKRLVAFVDRRDRKPPIDKVYLFEPPSVCRDIPNDACPEWHINASKLLLLPGLNKQQNEEKDEQTEQKKVKSCNIGCCGASDGGLLTVSFHVKAIDNMQCYLF